MLLKQSTTVTIQIGPFLDKTDGVAEEVGLAGSMVVEISKNNAAFAARGSATAITHDANGWYRVELNATDTGTLGRLVVKSDAAATYLPVWHEFTVVTANVYDSWVANTDKLQTDLTQWLGGTPNALSSGLVDAEVGAYDTGLSPADLILTTPANKLTTESDGMAHCDLKEWLGAAPSALITGRVDANAQVIGTGAIVAGSFGAGAIDAAAIATDAIGSAEFAQAAADKVWSTAARALTDKADFALSAASRALVADDVWDEARSGHVGVGSFGEGVASVQGNVTGSVASVTGAVGSVTGDVNGNVVGSVASVTGNVGGNVTGSVGSVAAGGITSGSFAAGAIDSAAIGTGAIDADAIAADAIGSSEFAQAAADKVWSSATRDLTDKTGFDLTQAAKDDIIAAVSGTADSGSVSTLVDAARTEADTDYWKGSYLLITSGNISGQLRRITGFTPGTDTITVAPDFTQAVGTNTYIILRSSAFGMEDKLPTGTISDFDETADNVTTDDVAAGAITTSSFAAGAIDAAAIATDAIGSAEFAQAAADKVWSTVTRALTDKADFALSVASRDAVVDDVWDEDATGHQTAGTFGETIGDSAATGVTIHARINQALPAAAPAANGGLPTVNASNFIAGIAGTKNDFDDLNDITTAQVNAEVVDVIRTDTVSQISAIPAANAPLHDMVQWLFACARNKRETTSTVDRVRNDGDTGNIATSTLSDDTTTFIRGEYA
jgi:hypothetical protein